LTVPKITILNNAIRKLNRIGIQAGALNKFTDAGWFTIPKIA